MKNLILSAILTFSLPVLLFSQKNFVITPVVSSYVSPDNVSAGFMVTLKTGRIIHFFRLDPGPNAGHTGNNGRIVKIWSDDGGTTWSKPVTIFDDEYDDRNVTGGILSSGRIVMFFRRFKSDLVDRKHIDYNLIYSDDNGETWSARTKISTEAEVTNSTFLPFIPGKGYMCERGGLNYVETNYSFEGIDWSKKGKVWDYRKDQKYWVTEACFAYTDNGKMIGLMRDDPDIPNGKSYFQVTSSDYGNSWTEPVYTNIADGYYCASPLVFYDSKHGDLWAIATDRRERNPMKYYQSELWIYCNKPDEVISNPADWHLVQKFPRPNPNNYIFYGYPCVTQKADGNYLIVFTESFSTNGREHCDFFQFEIKYVKP